MTEKERQSKEVLASMFLKLSRGETVSKEEASKARGHYNAFVMELENYEFIKDLNKSSGTNFPSPGHQNTNDLRKLQHENDVLKENNRIIAQELDYYKKKEGEQRGTKEVKRNDEENIRVENEKLKREFETLKKSHDMLSKELESYKRKPEYSMGKRLEKGYNTNVTGEGCATHEHKLEKLKNEKLDEGLRYLKNKEKEENVREENKKLHRENENLKKSHDNLSKELEHYKGKPEYSMSKGIEKGFNTGQEADSQAMEKLRQRNQQLIEERVKLNDQIKELRDRLSMMAGHKLTAGNPDIADLSDAYRPTKVAEQFSQLYDDEWTSAFDELQSFTNDEVELINILAKLVKELDYFCSQAQQQQLDRLKKHAIREMLEPEYHGAGHDLSSQKDICTEVMSQGHNHLADRLLKDFRKSFGILPVPCLRKSFDKVYMSPFVWESKEVFYSKSLKDFVGKALELVWVMKIQDPPMELTWCNRGDTFNKNMFTYYTNRGNTVRQCVWPAVLLHKDGPLMSKGVVQGM